MPSTPEGVVLKETVENQRIVENKVQDILSKFDVNLGTKGTGETVKNIGDINDPIRTYRGADLGKLEAKYTADPRLTVEMPYVGKGQKNSYIQV